MARTISNVSSNSSHGRGSSRASSDQSFISNFSNLSVNEGSAEQGFSYKNTPSYHINVTGTHMGLGAEHTRSGYGHAVTQPHSGYVQQPPSWTRYPTYNETFDPNMYTRNHSQNAYSNPVYSQSLSSSRTSTVRPSDEELLHEIGRDVILEPTAQSTPANLSPYLAVPSHRIFRGTPRNGTHERLNSS